MKKVRRLLDKTEHALHQHSMFTILVGRFVGPTRPLVPMVAGMLDLPVAKFGAQYHRLCVVATVLFSAGYPGGAAIDIPADMQSGDFKWLLLATALLLWVGGWFCWRLWRSGKERHIRSLNRVFPPQPFVVSGAVDARHRRGCVGGVAATSTDAGVYRYSA